MRTLLLINFTILTIACFGQKVPLKPARAIPQIYVYNIHGDTTNLKAVSNNKVTFIDFWFIPCGPCFVEMNMLHKIYARYKYNPNVAFLTVTLTDSAFVRPLIENRNTNSNETYNYFKKLADLDTFKLPVYFIKDVSSVQKSLKKDKIGYTGRGERPLKERSNYPNMIFGFTAYPTIMIFNKYGQLMYNKTGFTKASEKSQQKAIEEVIDHGL